MKQQSLSMKKYMLLLLLVIIPASAFAQTQGGYIRRTTKTTSGKVLEQNNAAVKRNKTTNNKNVSHTKEPQYTIIDEAKKTCAFNMDYIGENVTNFEIPSVINGYSVIEIKGWCLKKAINLQSITIPEGVVKIRQYAFAHCLNLRSVHIPSTVDYIYNDAFSDCPNLASITVDKDNKRYDSRDNCNAIIDSKYNELISGCKTTIIPTSVTSIGEHAFEKCTGLTSVSLPNNITTIGYYSFYGCKGLTSIVIPSTVKKIDTAAFSGCDGLSSIKVEDSNTTYDSRNNCNAIIETKTNTIIAGCKKTIIPSDILHIKGYAFYGTGITSITIPENVKTIGSWSLAGNKLKDVYSKITEPYDIDIFKYSNPPILHVPAGTKSAYEAKGWSKYFSKIVEQ